MCISASLSIQSFIIGSICSLLLIFFGNSKYKKENRVIGITFFFITIMQFFDYLFWIDVDGKHGINEWITKIAPLFNYLQPIFLYLLCGNTDIIPLIINIVYTIIILYQYSIFIKDKKNKLTTPYNNNGLHWKWIEYMNPYLYLLVFTFNLFYFIRFEYAFIVFLLTMIFLLGANFYRKSRNTVGSLWCFTVPIIPLILLLYFYR